MLQRVLLAVLLTGLVSCSTTDQTSDLDLPGVVPLDNFDKALGLYAQGLLVFEEDPSKGVELLREAVSLSPYEKRIIDDYSLHFQRKINRESSLDVDVSEHELLHKGLIETYSNVLKNYPDAAYVRLQLVDSFLALDMFDEAASFVQVEKLPETAPVFLAKVRYLRATGDDSLQDKLAEIFDRPDLLTDSHLHLTAILYLMEGEHDNHRAQVLRHAKQVISKLPDTPKKVPRAMPMTLIDGVLFGSDIGQSARNQSLNEVNYADLTAQWSILAGICMKLDLNKEAYLVIKHRLLTEVESRWRATVNLAICCQRLGLNKERIKYLEQALRLRPESTYTNRSLMVAHTIYGDAERALYIYENLHDDNDFWLQKIHFYILKKAGKYQSAFAVAEKIFNWPDEGRKISGMTGSLVSGIIPVYLKMGKPSLMEKRVQEAFRYLPNDMSFLNSIAYSYAEEDYKLEQAEEWIKEVYEKTQVISSYADTYAWICYKLGRYKEARVHIVRALELDKDGSTEILMHAGDIYFKLGYKEEALSFWDMALLKDPELADKVESRKKKLK